MKILDWVHRKFRQNSVQGIKDIISTDGQSNVEWRSSSSRAMMHSDDPKYGARERDRSDDVMLLFSNFQHGLLAIGTFGLDQVEGPEIESQGAKNLVEGDSSDVTPSEVELFHDQLEKVFGMKNADDAADNSRAKEDDELLLSNSDNSNNNNYYYFCSSSSNTRFHGKHDNNNNHHGNHQNVVYPLHEFFHSPFVESPAGRKKSTRTSLGDLFCSTRQLHESNNNDRKSEKLYNTDEKKRKSSDLREKSSAGFSFVKKILKRKANSTYAGGHGDLPAAERKLDKLMGIFHKKIHPDADHHGSAVASASGRWNSQGHKKHVINHVNYDEDRTLTSLTDRYQLILPKDNENKISCHAKNNTDRDNSESSLAVGEPQVLNQGHWIKTDADYVVLEL